MIRSNLLYLTVVLRQPAWQNRCAQYMFAKYVKLFPTEAKYLIRNITCNRNELIKSVNTGKILKRRIKLFKATCR